MFKVLWERIKDFFIPKVEEEVIRPSIDDVMAKFGESGWTGFSETPLGTEMLLDVLEQKKEILMAEQENETELDTKFLYNTSVNVPCLSISKDHPKKDISEIHAVLGHLKTFDYSDTSVREPYGPRSMYKSNLALPAVWLEGEEPETYWGNLIDHIEALKLFISHKLLGKRSPSIYHQDILVYAIALVQFVEDVEVHLFEQGETE